MTSKSLRRPENGRWVALLCISAMLACVCAGPKTVAEAKPIEPLLREQIKTSKRSTVAILITVNAASGTSRLLSGSGVVIGRDKIATCAHVVVPPDLPTGMSVSRIEVLLDNEWPAAGDGARTFFAEIEKADPGSDVAILSAHNLPWEPAEIGSSQDVAEGDEVFFIGHPRFSLEATDANAGPATGLGIVAAFEAMQLVPGGPSVKLIRLDARVNHGNSGGALFLRSTGQVVGIVNAKAGSISRTLKAIKDYQPSGQIYLGGLDPVMALKQTIAEMENNLQLGVGYAIPIEAFTSR